MSKGDQPPSPYLRDVICEWSLNCVDTALAEVSCKGLVSCFKQFKVIQTKILIVKYFFLSTTYTKELRSSMPRWKVSVRVVMKPLIWGKTATRSCPCRQVQVGLSRDPWWVLRQMDQQDQHQGSYMPVGTQFSLAQEPRRMEWNEEQSYP